jgi:hypothetical protein
MRAHISWRPSTAVWPRTATPRAGMWLSNTVGLTGVAPSVPRAAHDCVDNYNRLLVVVRRDVTDRRWPYGALARSRSRDRIADAAGPSAPLARRLKPRVNANVEPVLCEFEPSLFDQNPDIEHSRPETGARIGWTSPKMEKKSPQRLTTTSLTRGNVARIIASGTCRVETGLVGWPCRTRTRKCRFFVISGELLGFTEHFRTRDFSRTPRRDRCKSRRVKATFASLSGLRCACRSCSTGSRLRWGRPSGLRARPLSQTASLQHRRRTVSVSVLDASTKEKPPGGRTRRLRTSAIGQGGMGVRPPALGQLVLID